MGTRSMTYVLDHYSNQLCAIYRQYDGYPDENGMGGDLYRFLAGRNMVNGFGYNASWKTISNGSCDLAAQLVWYLKRDSDKECAVGNVYLNPLALDDAGRLLTDAKELVEYAKRNCGSEYVYIIRNENGKFVIDVYDCYYGKSGDLRLLYSGCAKGMPETFGYRISLKIVNGIDQPLAQGIE